MKRLALILLSGCALGGCETMQIAEPKTLGEINTGYNYIPVDPLEVAVLLDKLPASGTTAKEMQAMRYGRCIARGDRDEPVAPAPAQTAKPAALKAAATPVASKLRHSADVMDALPDHTIRMAVRSISGEGQGGFGPVTLSAKGTSYQVVMDSIFADTTNVSFGVRVNGGATSVYALKGAIPEGTAIEVMRLPRPLVGAPAFEMPKGYEEVTIPMYIGIGLRLTASLYTRKAGINLSNLPAIAASADAEQSSGALTMQTLGVFNQQVASTFAIPSELSTTSVQNALVSMGAVKAIVYDRDTGTRPRLVGLYNPLGTSDPRLINKIYAALASAPVPWAPCGSS
jgi:hypothetical protein